MEKTLSHIDLNGDARMVDTGSKPQTERRALAQALVRVNADTMKLLLNHNLPKGDALGCAKTGAILAAKQTANLIPLCHTLPLTFVDVNFRVGENPPEIKIITEARCVGRTGVEMEAIIAAQIAATIIYDFCKAVQRDVVISDVKLLYKTGGKSGEFRAPEFEE